MTGARFAIIIPHYEDHVRLNRCLSVVSQFDLTETEVVVVDNASPTSLENLISTYPMVRFVIEPTKGAAAARNRGVAETSAPNIFFLDADCRPSKNWLETAQGSVGPDCVIGGRVDVFDESEGTRNGAQAFETVFAFDQKSYIEKKNFSVTANLLTTRAVFDRTGPFVVGVSEDFDWCQRAVALGYDLRYEDKLVVGHPTRNDWEALRKKWRRLTDESFGLVGKSASSRLKWALRAFAMPFSALVHVPKIFANKDLRSLRERWNATVTLFRLRLVRSVWMLRQAIS